MQSTDSLPGDQKAVLQLVLARGRSYDQIARMLSIEPRAVRERAIAALDALGPQTRVADERRGLIADYLLGQLPSDRLDEVHDLLGRSAPERAWARVVSAELEPLAAGPLPEIPAGSGAASHAASPSPDLADGPVASAGPAVPPETRSAPAFDEPTWGDAEPDDSVPTAAPGRSGAGAAGRIAAAVGSGAAAEDASDSEGRGGRLRRGRRGGGGRRGGRSGPDAGGRATGSGGEPDPGGAGGPRSSRLGGMLVIALAVAIVAVVLIILLSSGGSSHHTPAASAPPASSTASTSTSATTTSGAAASTTSTSSSGAKVIAQINLSPPAGTGSKTAGIAEVLNEGTTDSVAIVAQNVAPNATKPPNAYAVWLYNSPTDAHILGFVNPGVGSTGRLSTAGALPSNASHYKQLIVTLETTAQPKTPGKIVLQGALTGL